MTPRQVGLRVLGVDSLTHVTSTRPIAPKSRRLRNQTYLLFYLFILLSICFCFFVFLQIIYYHFPLVVTLTKEHK